MRTPLLSWTASVLLHGAAALLALTWVVVRALEPEPEGASTAGRTREPRRRPRSDGTTEVRFRVLPPWESRERQEVGTS